MCISLGCVHREFLCEPAAEFFGVLILVVFGSGVNCAVTLSSNPSSVLGPPKGVGTLMILRQVAANILIIIGLAIGVFRLGSW